MNERDEKTARDLQEAFTRLEGVETRLTAIEAQVIR
jgi:hypothetical protein